MPTKMFINGCSFLTTRPKRGVNTHCGKELSSMMDLPIAENLAGGGRGNKRLMWTTRVWCEKFPDQASECFFVIGSSGGDRFDFPTGDGFKKRKFPTMETTWKTWDPNRDSNTESFFKYLFAKGLDIEQATQIESLLAIHDLQDFFKLRKYPYVMYNTLSDADIKNPDVLCVDEPMVYLDEGGVKLLLDLFKERELGAKSTILSSQESTNALNNIERTISLDD